MQIISKILIKYKKMQDVRIQHNISSENLIPLYQKKQQVNYGNYERWHYQNIQRVFRNEEIELSHFDELLERGLKEVTLRHFLNTT
jgi:hypothetical protein